MSCVKNALVLLSVAAVFAAAQFYASRTRLPYPQAGEIKVFRGSEVEDAAALCLGLRRLAADINFIRLLQYYGDNQSHEGAHHHHHHEDGDAHDEPKIHEQGPSPFPEYHVYGITEREEAVYNGGGTYGELLPRAMHILTLDPYDRFAAIYTAGALAFNQDRPDEALQLLEYARRYVPGEIKYKAYIAAIGYSKAKDPVKVAEIMEEIIKDPECPAMIKQQTAFLNRRIKHYRRAYEIYQDIARTSKDRGYVDNAIRQMEALKPMLRQGL